MDEAELDRPEDRDRDREDRDREGVGGRGFSSSFVNSLNNRSSPGCICRAIMGKWFKRSENDFTSFLRGRVELGPPEIAFFGTTGASCFFGIKAGVIVIASYVPINGRDIKYTSHGWASYESG